MKGLLLLLLCVFAVTADDFLEELSKPTLFPLKQAAKRSLAQKILDQKEKSKLQSIEAVNNDITSTLTTINAPPSEYWLISIDIGHNNLPTAIYDVPKLKDIMNVGSLKVILVKSSESRDAVLTHLRSAGYFNYQVEKSYQHDLHVQNTLDRLDQHSLPLDNTYTSIGEGAGTHIYIVDSGILSTHEQFAGRLVIDYVTPGQNATPCNFHGSWVASAAAGETIGVAPLAIIHDVHVGISELECSFYTSTAISALSWIYENGTLPGVINLSWQGPGNSVLDAVIGQLYALGYFIVTAAGNANSNTAACLNSPARAPYALSVGAIDDADSIAYFSNYGDCVDIWALGTDVPGADITGDSDYIIASGTSISAPVVSGLAAVYYSLFHYTASSQIKTELELSSVYGEVMGMAADLSNNRIASIYLYQEGASVPTPTTGTNSLNVF